MSGIDFLVYVCEVIYMRVILMWYQSDKIRFHYIVQYKIILQRVAYNNNNSMIIQNDFYIALYTVLYLFCIKVCKDVVNDYPDWKLNRKDLTLGSPSTVLGGVKSRSLEKLGSSGSIPYPAWS